MSDSGATVQLWNLPRAVQQGTLHFLLATAMVLSTAAQSRAESPQPFGAQFPKLDSLAVGEWWKAVPPKQNPPPVMNVPRAVKHRRADLTS